jgi:uncharacterized membrane protein YsdA (DUF1294 family)/cold shock CspA family protein
VVIGSIDKARNNLSNIAHSELHLNMAEHSPRFSRRPNKADNAAGAVDLKSEVAEAPLLKGELVEWKDEKGFGFVRPEAGGRDYFVHITAFQKGMSRRPRVGDIIHFHAKPETRSSGQRRIALARVGGIDYEPAKVLPSRLELVIEKILVALPILFSSYLIWRAANPIPLVSYIFMSSLTVLYYAADKKWALENHWRIPEFYLHCFEMLGGWPGALLAQNRFRHKLKKPSYQRLFWTIVSVHGLLWSAFFYGDLGFPIHR